MMDYRGFGLSTGKSSEASMYKDVESCLDWLISKGVSGDKTIMYGYSLGTIPAIDLSAFYGALPVNKLIIESEIGC